MLLEVLLARSAQFHCHKFVAALLESLDDLANESALDTVGFDSDKSTFTGHSLKFFQKSKKKFKKSKNARKLKISKKAPPKRLSPNERGQNHHASGPNHESVLVKKTLMSLRSQFLIWANENFFR